jgi:beta-aspartyl-dipeptidase (metallo-type)
MFLRLLHADVHDPEPHGIKDVLVAGERIVAIADAIDPLPPSLPCETIDLAGRRLVPGLVDGHAHLAGGGGEAGPATRVPRLFAGRLAQAGVTTSVGVLGTDCTTRTMRELVATVLGLRAEGLSSWCWTGGYAVPVGTLTGSVRDDMVWVDPILGVGELAVSDHRSSQPTLDEILRIAADVHVAGMLASKAGVLHLHMGDGRRGLELVRRALDGSELPASVFHPTHVNRNPGLLREAQALAKEHGCTIDITAFPDADLGDAVPAAEAIVACLDAGVPIERITCSSDGGGCMPTFDADGRLVAMGVGEPSTLVATLARLVGFGLPLASALAPSTSNVARVLRLPNKGRIAVGGDADLVALDERGGVAWVIARGRPWVREGSLTARGTFEE